MHAGVARRIEAPRSGKVGRLRRATLRASALAPAVLAGACMAWNVAGRGVPHEGEVRYYTLQMAAIDIPAATGHHGGPQPAPLRVSAPFDGWIHGYSWDLVGPDGRPVGRDALHHIKLAAPDRRELFSHQMLRIAGAGRETGPVKLPTQVGYRVRAGDPLLMTAMMHNSTGVPLEGVRVRLHLRYSPAGPWRDPLSAYPFFAHVTAPGEETAYDLPPGPSERSIVLQPAISGRVLALGGHLHDYGEELRFEDAASGRVLWKTRPVRDGAGAVLSVPSRTFVMRGGISIEAGRSYRFVAVYDNPTGAVIPGGGMATLGGMFAPDEPWPDADTTHPIYVWDMEREVSSYSAHGAHSGHGGS